MVVVTSDLDCPYNVERAHGGRPCHAFARPDLYSATRSQTTLHGLPGRDLDSGCPALRGADAWARPCRSGRGHLTPIAPRHLEPARIRPRHPPRRSVSACTNALPTASRAVATDLSRSASPPVLVLTNDAARA